MSLACHATPVVPETHLKTTVRTPTKSRLVHCSARGARPAAARCTGDTGGDFASLLCHFEAQTQRLPRAIHVFFILFGTRTGPGRDPARTRVPGSVHPCSRLGTVSRPVLCPLGAVSWPGMRPEHGGLHGGGPSCVLGHPAGPSGLSSAPLWARVPRGSRPGPDRVPAGSRKGPTVASLVHTETL